MAKRALAGFFILAAVCSVGLGVASADSADELARAGAFGFDEMTTSATVARNATVPEPSAEPTVYERSVLATPSSRDLSTGYAMIDELERAEQERIERENAEALERAAANVAKQGVAVSQPVAAASADGEDGSGADQAVDPLLAGQPEVMEYALPAVDWTVGRDAFVDEWAARIDAYLAGSPLSGYGRVFAEAAWDNGVDPRWSPAISNTESSKGSVCFRSCNAWGWGNMNWPDWETAIRDHVAGLAAGYGYSITLEGAYRYCPGTHVDWYNKTLAQMALI